MATEPHKPPPPPSKPHDEPPKAAAPAVEIVETVADEQRKRSEHIEEIGVEPYKRDEMDDRPEDERGGNLKPVPGAQSPKATK